MNVPLFSDAHIYVALQHGKILCRKPGSFDFEECTIREVAELHCSCESTSLLFLAQDASDLYRQFTSTSRTKVAKIIRNFHHIMDQCPGQLSEALVADHVFGRFSNAPTSLPWTAGEEVDWWEVMNNPLYKYASFENGNLQHFSHLYAVGPGSFNALPAGSQPFTNFLTIEYVKKLIAGYRMSNMLDTSRSVKISVTFNNRIPAFATPSEYSECDQVIFRNLESSLIDEVHHVGAQWGRSAPKIWDDGQFTVEVEAQFTEFSHSPVWIQRFDQWPPVKEKISRLVPVDVVAAQ